MTFKEWFNGATPEEREEVRRVAAEAEGLEPFERSRVRTRFKVGKLCRGRGWTIVRDTAARYLRWRVKAAEGWEEMQFGSEEEAVAFARAETLTVATWIGSIVPLWLVLPDGRREVL